MRKFLLIVLSALCALSAFAGETTVPDWYAGGNGEICEISEDGTTAVLRVVTGETPAEAALRLWPDALILRDTPESILIIAPYAAVSGITEEGAAAFYAALGEFFTDGTLTEAGASAVMALYRPGLVVTEIELDIEDGIIVYEGEALLEGSEYEFELDMVSCRLLEWERD